MLRLLEPPAHLADVLLPTAHKFLRNLEAKGIQTPPFHPAPFQITVRDRLVLERDLRIILRAACEITQRVFGGSVDAHARYLRLNRLQRLFADFPLVSAEALIARPDLMHGREGLKLMELNIGSGVGYFPETHLYRSYAASHSDLLDACLEDPLPAVQTMLSRWQSVVYLDSEPVHPDRTRAALNRLWIWNVSRGLNVCRVPNRSSALFLGFSTYQLEDRLICGDTFIWDLLKKHSSQVICPPSTVLLENKLNLVLFSDARYAKYFDREQVAAFERLVPWTRHLDSRTSKKVLQTPSAYILKRAGDRGGNSLVLCCQCTKAELQYRMSRAVEDRNWIAQKYVEPQALSSSSVSVLHSKPLKLVGTIVRVFFIDDRIAGIHCSTSEDLHALAAANGWSAVAIVGASGAAANL